MTNRPKIRYATWADLPQLSKSLAQAFYDDELFGDFIHPHRAQHPKDMELYWLRRLRVNYCDPRWRILAAIDQDADGKELVVGCAQWTRMGKGGSKLDRWWFDPRNLLQPLVAVAMRVHRLIWPGRAVDPQNEDILERAHPYFEHMYDGERAENWSLEWLGVDPDHQGKSLGRELVRWGLDRADEDEGDVWTVVIAAKGKDRFYQNCGFGFIEGSGTMGEGNPLANMEGANMHWRRPVDRKSV
ncbi:hypothetical protein BD289DRAFT_364322 [Coniella lustricola]|uniref:N-acetyltransferase domain-containing protein n=1 Tax=Coniella lustricola TaxID=2025994 RepID=A0A2T3ADY0_9PEZI|nr:hypothetical protein BD289DRAFT_364322 [Coniella lustricola]